MRPTLAAEELKTNLTQYLSTTFALADPPVREALEKFLNHPVNGIFRGPYLRIRTPFRAADEGWRDILEWAPEQPVPYLHQAQAWRRLSSLDREPQPTLVTTGTGSGKTEAFLIPVLDHCRRAKQAGKRGVKAVLLYPMNALATDQAMRISDLPHPPRTQGRHRRPVHRRGAGHDLPPGADRTVGDPVPAAGHPDHELQDAGPAAAARRGPRAVAGRGHRLRGGGRVPHLRRRAGHRRGDAAAPAGRRHEPLTARQAPRRTSARSRHPPRWGRAGTRNASGRSPSRSSAPRSARTR